MPTEYRPLSDDENPAQLVLRIQGVTKKFGKLVANDDVSLNLHRSEVLALLGENGAGKTTLMNILFGHYVPDAGTIEAFGKILPHGSPNAAMHAGIGMVHQHFALGDNLSVLDNVMIGTRPLSVPFLNRRRGRDRLMEVSRRSGLATDPDALVSELTVGEQQRLEILKALYRGAQILILDEPTAVLTPQETEQLFDTVRNLVAQGMSVIFISHKLKEVMSIADRVVVLRSGRAVFEARTSETSRGELARQMVGREIGSPDRVRLSPGSTVLEMQDVQAGEGSFRNALKHVNLTVHTHEILGVAGVSGNGQQSLFDVICGVRRPSSGTIIIGNYELRDGTPAAVIAQNVARIPEDRHSTGLLVDLRIWENMISESYRQKRFQSSGWVRRNAAIQYSEEVIREFDVRCSSPNATTRLLSGGNMQKLILGRTLSRDPGLIIASQPTRGLDVGAVSFVHQRLLAGRASGAGILLISEDLDELLQLSDRIVVMFRGRVSAPLDREDATVEKLGLMMAGHSEEFRDEV